MKSYCHIVILALQMVFPVAAKSQDILYTMPAESDWHEGTWLQWPHNHLYGPWYRDDLKETWLSMTAALVEGEKVHIIAYDEVESNYIEGILADENIPMDNIDFYIHENNDCWVRDNGPVFVFDENDSMVILDWGFNGWGGDYPSDLCDLIPSSVGSDIDVPVVDLSAMVLEGGAVEIDGNGTFLGTRSSILNDDRNPGLSETDIENYMTTHLGISQFIWLEGVEGLEVTDMHIDGFAKFHEGNTIVTMDSTSLIYWDVPPADISTLYHAADINGIPYNMVFLPLTVNDVITTWEENVGFKGSYVNYYIGNTAVLVPTYNDPNDAVALEMIQELFPSRTVVGIDCRNLFYGGGMVHCVTQQQPFSESFNAVNETQANWNMPVQIDPNPCNIETRITFQLLRAGFVRIEVYDVLGNLNRVLLSQGRSPGEISLIVSAGEMAPGIYPCAISLDGHVIARKKIVVNR